MRAQGDGDEHLSVHVRPASWDDVQVCLTIEMAYITSEVWQLRIGPDAGPSGVTVDFRPVRLTRRLEVPYPRTVDELQTLWQQGVNDLLVAEWEDRVVGFVDLAVPPAQDTVWLHNLVVDRPLRRRGVGSTLLGAAAAWARERGIRRLLLEAPTKNSPAIHFCFTHGAEFCGFRDRYYANHDIAVFFEYRIM
ncbi:MAG: GNAT family N-acetyltransferase [Ardenticatenia bacterium]|nr:GNAT family N-acetyltransferase [Ardenticatenia bacterium]